MHVRHVAWEEGAGISVDECVSIRLRRSIDCSRLFEYETGKECGPLQSFETCRNEALIGVVERYLFSGPNLEFGR